MKENITYGECLSEILFAFNIKANWLAREINIDSSLVYKWLRNERVPPYGSPYISLILTSISKKLSNSSSKKAVIEVLSSYEVEMSETSDTHILNQLRLVLEISRDHSAALHQKKKRQRQIFSSRISGVADFNENIDTCGAASSGPSPSAQKQIMHVLPEEEPLSSCFDQVQIIQGNMHVLQAALALLQQASKVPRSSSSILITLNGDDTFLRPAKVLLSHFIKTLNEVLVNGWKVVVLVKLDSNTYRTIKIIEGMQTLLSAGSLKIYYHKNTIDPGMVSELFIVPEVGALLSLSTCTKNQIDSAFLFRSKESIGLLTANYYQSLAITKPLLKSYPSQYSVEIQKVFAECEEVPGDKYVIKEGLSTITMPADLYEKYLGLDGETNQEIKFRVFLHNKRLTAFQSQIMHFEFKDICFIESIEALVDHRRYSSDENYLLRNGRPSYHDIACHLENVVHLLKTHRNYEIAFVNQMQYQQMTGINWMVKGTNSVLIETFRNGLQTDGRLHSEMNFFISEKNTVEAFHDYFMILWNDIPDKNKDKDCSIAWLKQLIEECERRAGSEND